MSADYPTTELDVIWAPGQHLAREARPPRRWTARLWPAPSGDPLRAGVLGAAVVAGHFAGVLVRFDAPGGALALIGVPVLAVALGARGGRPAARDLAVSAPIVALLAVAAFRSAEWLVAACVLAALGLAPVLLVGARTWTGIAATPLATLGALPRAARWTGEVLSAAASGWLARARGAVVVAAITVAVVGVFAALFAGADAAFARLLEHLLPDANLAPLVGRAQVAAGVATLAVVLATLVRHRPPVDSLAPSPGRTCPRTAWAVPVGALVGLFASFVAVQFAVLFGGHRRILEGQGLTYAEYARQGFGQLVAVTAGVLVVVAVTVRVAPRATVADRALLRALLGALCVLALVVVASAVHRMSIYEQAYGFTRLRLAATAIELFGGAVLVMVLVVGIRRNPTGLAPAVLAAGMAGLLAFAALNPDAWIAERNVDRYERTGDVDLAYLSGLSADAVPALLRLPTPLRDCALAGLATRLRDGNDPWFDPNRSRDRARRIFADVSPEC